jgi:hypothetical protein
MPLSNSRLSGITTFAALGFGVPLGAGTAFGFAAGSIGTILALAALLGAGAAGFRATTAPTAGFAVFTGALGEAGFDDDLGSFIACAVATFFTAASGAGGEVAAMGGAEMVLGEFASFAKSDFDKPDFFFTDPRESSHHIKMAKISIAPITTGKY